MEFHELLKAEAAQQNQIKRDKLAGLGFQCLVAYCEEEIQKDPPFDADEMRGWAFRDFLKGDDYSGTIGIAQQHKKNYEALRDACAALLQKQHEIPPQIERYILNVELGAVAPPPSKKIGKNGWRDERICRCINDLQLHGDIQLSKSEDSGSNAITAFEIVAEAAGLTYGNVKSFYYRNQDVANGTG